MSVYMYELDILDILSQMFQWYIIIGIRFRVNVMCLSVYKYSWSLYYLLGDLVNILRRGIALMCYH